ncbi:MAG: molybdopterin molybdotransferase [Bacteroidales bacterium]|jgi:molybdopterin molybdotransferase|nr:molybdopterin molybdotransferase [Bacteroidales bacterium]MDN5329422.1 molybdopterin molybdotransferase [Bacteroidales bacterium]
MVTLEEAIAKTMAEVWYTAPERVPLSEVSGRVLAEDIRCDIDMPPFEKAAVDGFACRAEDLGNPLEIIETISAGKVPQYGLKAGTCSRIMTGAMIPEGCDAIIPVEDTTLDQAGRVIFTGKGKPVNIAHQGEDIRKGEKVLESGTLIQAQHIAVLATSGVFTPAVYRRPVCGILATGDELVEPWNVPGPGQIRNSNAWQTIAQVKDAGADFVYTGIAPDNPAILKEKIDYLLSQCDVLLMSGGVSMGEYDYVPQVMKELGLEIIFKNIAIQPGRPTLFGKIGRKIVFGLPGNPVSGFIQFELLVKPFLKAMVGLPHSPVILHLPMGESYLRKKAKRRSLIPVRILDNKVFTLNYNGSAHINAYTQASGFIELKEGVFEVKEGEWVYVRQI